ncbi:MAG: site-specific integrase [Myxococcales bacterium]|nr:site-specific integrase [Myxococcales bacterium]
MLSPKRFDDVHFAQLAEINIRLHLVPFFGKLRLAEIEERHLLRFIVEKTERVEKPLRASTLTNILSVLRRVMTLAVEQGQLSRNPCQNLGKLLAKVRRHQAQEVGRVDSWTREEVATLFEIARAKEPRFHPLLFFLISTGCRKGEALGLKWDDVDFSASRVRIRRALVRGQLGTPKSGRARFVVLSPALAEILHDLFAQRRRECLTRGWSDVPEFVFCSETGGLMNERNVARSWYRLRRKAQRHGVRPLRLHDCRHTFASLALASGKSVRWVAAQLGHANPELTLRVYAHALREEETDLSFLDFGGTKRHPRGTEQKRAVAMKKPLRVTPRRGSDFLERETGIEPATLSLGRENQPEEDQ